MSNVEGRKLDRKELDRYFVLFLITTVGSIYIGGDSKIGMILDLLALVSLVILIAKVIAYRQVIKKQARVK